MVAKSKTIYVCSNCGQEFLKWSGKCEACGEWNTLKELKLAPTSTKSYGKSEAKEPVNFDQISQEGFSRLTTGISEFDRTVGGGIVPGSVILLGGDPGIGKSTLILQVLGKLALGLKTSLLYVSGEESAEQIKMRADRLQITNPKSQIPNLQFLAETNIDSIVSTIDKTKPALVVIDSIQTMWQEDIPSSSGSIAQVRACALKLIELAKTNHIPTVLIGHVTKGGEVAGPKTLEHLVDCVLYLEGERYGSYRVLRGTKNRFGSTDEAGIFEMKESGMVEVKNPSGVFLEERQKGESGSVVTATLEGTRTFLLEIQALTTHSSLVYPRRTASGFDFNRMQLLVAVLQKKAGLRLDSQDIYLNIVGGFKVREPAIDLAACLAIASSYTGKTIDPEMVVLGEVGLNGEIRSVSKIEKRISEAGKLGFKRVLIPAFVGQVSIPDSSVEIVKVRAVPEAIGKALI